MGMTGFARLTGLKELALILVFEGLKAFWGF